MTSTPEEQRAVPGRSDESSRAGRERLPSRERRNLMLERSKQVFAEHTYAGASTSVLAEACGVSEPMLYKHFGSKKGLFLAVLHTYVYAALEDWQSKVEELADEDCLGALRRAAYQYFMSMSDLQLSALLLQAMAASFDDPELGKVVHEFQGRLVEVIHGLLARAQREGIVPANLPLVSAAWGLVSNLIVIQFNRMAYPRPEDLPKDVQEFGRQMVNGSVDIWLHAIQTYPG